MPFFKLEDIFAERYLLVELLSKTRSFELWKAKDQLAEEVEVMLKIHTPEKEPAQEGVEQLRQEFSSSQALSHPHLLKVNHFDIWNGYAFLVMPYCPGGSLKRLLDEKVSFSERQVARLMSQMGAALEVLHQHETPVLHQEVRPENILLAQPDIFLLAHLNMGALTGEDSGHTYSALSETEAYAPPESNNLFEEMEPSADIYSLGVVMYQMCTQSLPPTRLTGESSEQGVVAKLSEQYSTELSGLIQACLSAERIKRPTAKELHARAEHYLNAGSWELPHSSTEKGGSARKIILYTLAVAVFLLLIISSFWAYKNDDLHFSAGGERSNNSAKQEDLDAMLISTLEEELEQMEKRARELEMENRQLKGTDSPGSILMNNEEPLAEEEQEQLPDKTPQQPMQEPEESPAEPRSSVQASGRNDVSHKSALPGVKETTREETASLMPEKLEVQLNTISNPSVSQEKRKALKEDLMSLFSEQAGRILEEKEGETNQYSASIFLNLLYKVPHSIEVEEVKMDENQKITEIRLSMQAQR
ncbi:serine/threonine protein kinase [Nafulsella turpanensis]|uniref:serine/threonine protein kinase n=1 Tax=Nafulsella turpanensis TaxID=1265690 RepID=UPI00034BD462|nr:protein kinase [Nafulsella turpanensis]